MLEGISLRDCFSVIVSAEDVTVGKPDPMGYLMTTKLMSDKAHHPLHPADCLIVEDAPNVIRSVRSVGFPVLAVATSYPLEKLTDANWRTRSLEPDEIRKAMPHLNLDAG